MTLYAKISKPSDRVLVTLFDLLPVGQESLWTEVPTVADCEAFIAAHPEAQAVNFTGSWMPQRPVAIERVDAKLIRKQYRYVKAVV